MCISGRPPATAPRGRVILPEAAELADVSYSLVHRYATAARCRASVTPPGVITLARRDPKLPARLLPADMDRKAEMLRPTFEHYAAWERAAGDKPVSVWLGELADKATGWKG